MALCGDEEKSDIVVVVVVSMEGQRRDNELVRGDPYSAHLSSLTC